MKDFIAGETRAKSLAIGHEVEVEGELVNDWNIEDVKMRMGIGRGYRFGARFIHQTILSA